MAPRDLPVKTVTSVTADAEDLVGVLFRAVKSRTADRESMTSWPSHARAQGDEKIVQLLERLAHRIRRPGAGSVERFLRGIEFVHDQQRLATFFLEGHRGDRPTVTTFRVGPHETRVRC